MSDILSLIGLAGAALCLGAYVYGCLLKPAGARWLSVMSLFCTIVALAELSFALSQDSGGWRVNAGYAMVFLFMAGLAQGLNAVRTRASAE